MIIMVYIKINITRVDNQFLDTMYNHTPFLLKLNSEGGVCGGNL